ncbi:hypothetical protein ZYGR_0N04370 [Zygosaccharomyces rouxii]|uniref:Exosome complex protein n=1 Tax=Zygosaccharomyces rouxii TaxID=4956 RepID=A0A1Q3A039_ZYGRO|nr:hypothetical protein ZYGR_0N04370 [Zygosaccharomyces rouxii]
MEDINKIKPYIAHLDRQLQDLRPLLESLNAKSLDEQLSLLSDERQRLDLTNTYAYLLSSLMFAHMKVLNCRDMSSVMGELARVKRYMDSAKQLDSSEEQKEQNKHEEQNRAKQVINRALTPSISQANFQGKHTKFESKDDTNSSDDDGSKDKEDKVDVSTKKKNLPGRTKGKSETVPSKSKNQHGKSTKGSGASSTKTGKSNRVSKPSTSSKPKGKVNKSNR